MHPAAMVQHKVSDTPMPPNNPIKEDREHTSAVNNETVHRGRYSTNLRLFIVIVRHLRTAGIVWNAERSIGTPHQRRYNDIVSKLKALTSIYNDKRTGEQDTCKQSADQHELLRIHLRMVNDPAQDRVCDSIYTNGNQRNCSCHYRIQAYNIREKDHKVNVETIVHNRFCCYPSFITQLAQRRQSCILLWSLGLTVI